MRTKEYQEVNIPPPERPELLLINNLIKISSLPSWMQPAFQNMHELNTIQSAVYECAANSSANMLLCELNWCR